MNSMVRFERGCDGGHAICGLKPGFQGRAGFFIEADKGWQLTGYMFGLKKIKLRPHVREEPNFRFSTVDLVH